jgi:hypothetical protein
MAARGDGQLDRRPQIDPGVAVVGMGRQREVLTGVEALEGDVHHGP